MILTVTLNPCLHKIVYFRGSIDDRIVVRPVQSQFVAGGKGVNAARAIHKLGGEVYALTTAGGLIGEAFLDSMRREGIRHETIPVQSMTRMSTMVFGEDLGLFREFLEPGLPLQESEIEHLKARFDDLLSSASLVLLCGSVPAPELNGFWAWAIGRCREVGRPVLVDTYGEAAVSAAQAGPQMIKANRDEVLSSFGVDVSEPEKLAEFAQQLRGQGAEYVLITDGAKDAWLFGPSGDQRIVPPPVPELSPVGSGDAMLGAMAWRISSGYPPEQAVGLGAAAGAANAAQLSLCDFDPKVVEELEAQVQITASATESVSE